MFKVGFIQGPACDSCFETCTDDQILQELYQSTLGESGEDQAQKGTQLLEIYALEIQMHNERKNYKKLKVSMAPLFP